MSVVRRYCRQVKGRAVRSRTRTAERAAIRVEAPHDNPEQPGLALPGMDEPCAPTHWFTGRLNCGRGPRRDHAAKSRSLMRPADLML